MRKTAEAYNWKLTGKPQPCKDCQIGEKRQKDVAKETDAKSTVPGERIFVDIASIDGTTMGGSKFPLGVVDDATDVTRGKMLKSKREQTPKLMEFLRHMKQRGTPVKCVRCDNTGENKSLMNECVWSSDLNDTQFEFAARSSPQFNGKIERQFAAIFGRIRINKVAANIQGKLRTKPWGQACTHAVDVENPLVSSRHEDPFHREFHMAMWRDVHVEVDQEDQGQTGGQMYPSLFLLFVEHWTVAQNLSFCSAKCTELPFHIFIF